MLTHSTRRWLAGIGVAGAFVAASATPVVAAPAAEDLLLYANNALITPGGEARYVTLYAYTEALPEDVTVTVDRSAVTDFASVTLTDKPKGCTEDAAVITCALKGADTLGYVLNLTVVAKDSAAIGAKGDLVFSLTADGRKSTTRSSVAVGEGVDLKAGDDAKVSGAPGATVKAPLTVANVGDKTTHGAVLFLATMSALAPTQRYSNCSYLEDFGSIFAQCQFDDDIAPGTALRLDGSAGLRIASDAWAPGKLFGQAVWFTQGDWDTFVGEFPSPDEWQKGSGDPLRLVAATTAQTNALQQTDKDMSNNVTGIWVSVTGNQRADVAAVGAELPGTVGKTVTGKVGFVNNGPAMTNSYSPGGEIVSFAQVTIPAGATVVKAPKQCSPGKDGEDGGYGEPGGRVYFCEWYDTLHKGDSAVFEFGLRIDKVGGAPGSVKLLHFDLDNGPAADLNPKNDIAPLVIKGAAGGGAGGQGGGGTLPITGSSTGLIAGLGALLLAAGVGGYVVAKRRRTRFVA